MRRITMGDMASEAISNTGRLYADPRHGWGDASHAALVEIAHQFIYLGLLAGDSDTKGSFDVRLSEVHRAIEIAEEVKVSIDLLEGLGFTVTY